ncbi:hypothetical protein TcWFU_005375 [Taenia crassiceps]|uniref:Delta-like protein n=1 Tax=Taenia crassiceps TaxID=6207 RepID=A0ABR4Q1J8_9CEST
MEALFWPLFVLVSYPSAIVTQEMTGEVKLSFFFESQDGRLPHGQTCDPWPYTKCDVYLTICITSQGDGSCNVYSHRTGLWEDANVGQAAVAFPLKHPVPESLDVFVEVWDADTSGSPDSIAKFKGNLIVAGMQNTPSAFAMVREDAASINKVRLESYGHIICARFYYGGDCSRKCMPDPERYACDVNGYKKCRRGFLGVECDIRDYCLNHTCAGFAECINTPSGFECWCFQSKGPECHLGYDPCASEYNTCSGHGTCTPAGDYNLSFQCTCESDWEGRRCDQRRPACLVALVTNLTLCQNGGMCRDLPGNVGAYICDCSSGWWGKHCEKKTAVVYKLVLLITVAVGICLVILALIGFVLDICCKNCLRHRRPTFTCMSSSQLPKQRINCRSSSSEAKDCVASQL